MRILIADAVSANAAAVLREAGLEVDELPTISPNDLCQKISRYDGMIIRSRTKIDAMVLKLAERLKIIGRAGVGVDNIDVEAATKKNILVCNAPRGNENAVAEHTIGLMFALLRRIPFADSKLKNGHWLKSSLVGRELCGKKVGIIGCGRIGRLVAQRLKNFGVDLLGYDVVPVLEGGIRRVDLDTLFQESDVITVHVSLTAVTARLINAETIQKMRPSAFLINTSRGGVVDEEALLRHLADGRLAGAALDVFEEEPLCKTRCDTIKILQDRGVNIIVTPHVAGQTEEAEERIGENIVQTLILYLKEGIIRDAVNAPYVETERFRHLDPYRLLAKRLTGFLRQFCGVGDGIENYFEGDFTAEERGVLERIVLRDTLEVGYVNAALAAEERGFFCHSFVKEEKQKKIGLRFIRGSHAVEAVGRVDEGVPLLVSVNGYVVGGTPLGGQLLVFINEDVPGVFAKVLGVLAGQNLNISRMQSGNNPTTNQACAVVSINRGELSPEVIAQIGSLPEIKLVRKISLP
ncbi:MAG: hypothetical protein HYW89_01215 [Candidatus Sungiibacteriota bacterium]|uniref:D-3-phosphoglycerate dehydrogenase n=1 Tax=Candidatus Sungiibacteriota bacterium TaxID=2750080 RepID=A0A7T5RK19_9BACT|nr:MAG: hypothetical protein HYW89_01215 [Candidatus Sungbacteria bacterium]